MKAGSIGTDSTDANFLKLLIEALKKKKRFSQADGAWEQYRQLADWLLEICCRVVIRNSTIENEFKEIVSYSLEHCSRKKYLGYSWHAYTEWNTRWDDMKPENRTMLRELVENGVWDKDCEIETIHKRT